MEGTAEYRSSGVGKGDKFKVGKVEEEKQVECSAECFNWYLDL